MTLDQERLFLAAVTASTLIKMFKGLSLESYKTLGYGFQIDFSCREKLDKTFTDLLEENLALHIREAEEAYPMHMMWDNAVSLLQHQGQALLAESYSFGKKSLVEMVKFGDLVLVAPHIPCPRMALKLLSIENKGKGQWCLTGAAFTSKEELKDFLKLYAKRRSFDPFFIALSLGFITEQGLWLEPGITWLEELRKAEEHFWQKRGFVRVFGDEKVFPDKAIKYTQVIENKNINSHFMACDGPRLWAIDKTQGISLKEAFSPLKPLKAFHKEEGSSLFVRDPLGTFYETGRCLEIKDKVSVSLFGSPIQMLGLLLQESGGHLERALNLKKEMFEFRS